MLRVPLCQCWCQCWCQCRQGMLVLPWSNPTALCGISSLDAGDRVDGCPKLEGELSPRGPAGSILPSPCLTQCSSLQSMGRRGSASGKAWFIPSPPLTAGFLSPTSPSRPVSCPCPVFTVVSGEWRAHGQTGCPKAGMGDGFPQNQLLTGRQKT